jgi:hypothetical protein
MTKAIVFSILVAMALLVGCGSSSNDVAALRAEQNKALDQARARIDTLAAELRRAREDIRALDSDLFDLRGQLDLVLAEVTSVTRARAELATAEGPTEASAGAAEEASTQPIEANVETMAVELTKVRDLVTKLNNEYRADKELAELRDPRQTWEAMGDPEQLGSRLDRFAQTYAPTIEDVATRDQFVADVKALKDQVDARANMTVQEQVDHYQTRLTEQINAETNDRMRQFYERQLETLTSGDEEAVAQQLQRAALFENTRSVGELAEKYDVPRETLRDNGLMSFGRGGFGGGGPGGRTGGQGGGARGGGRTSGR